MFQKSVLGGSLAVLVSALASAHAQQPAVPPPYTPATAAAPIDPNALPELPPEAPPPPIEFVPDPIQAESNAADAALPNTAIGGLESHSLPGEMLEDIDRGTNAPRFGATPVANVRFMMDTLGISNLTGDSSIRTFGWVEGGYTGASTGRGILSVEPRLNRYGNEFLLNQIGWAIQKPLKQNQFDWGFNMRYFAGADAALGAAKGGIGWPAQNPQFGQDFRDLYLQFHLPVLTDGGVDLKIGRMNTIIGYNGFLAPYRPFYSSDYQFFYSQDGAFTGFLANLHVNKQLDVWSGMTLGANTFFTLRSNNSYCYIGQVNYWLTPEQRTRLTASVYTGPNSIFAAPNLAGTDATTVELRVQQNWNPRFMQVLQNNMGWDRNTPVGTGSWYGLYLISIYHLSADLDIQSRVEWFDDVKGTRTGVATDYSEVTLGLNWHPVKYLEIRPEIRGDFAAAPAFGVNGAHTNYSQLSGGVSFLVKF